MASTAILTVDHEVFGNGSGSVANCMLQPLSRMLETVARYDALLTLFVEPLELAFRERTGSVGAREVSDACDQIKTALAVGHDLQLHLHPQWWPALRGHAKGPSIEWWRIGDLSGDVLEDMIDFGLRWLRERLELPDSSTVVAFRGGGWCIQPERDVLRSISRAGIRIDSSVAVGETNLDGPGWFDFRAMPERPFWYVRESLAVPEASGVLEVPICAGSVGWLRHVAWRTIRRLSCSNGFAERCRGIYQGRSGRRALSQSTVRKILSLRTAMLDFCSLSAAMMRRLVVDHLQRFPTCDEVPIVAIGHSKNYDRGADRELSRFLAWIERTPDLAVGTFGEWLSRQDRTEAQI